MAKLDERILHACFYGFLKPYQEYLSLMQHLHAQVAVGALANQLMLLEHAPVITVTRQHQHKSLLTSPEQIKVQGIDLCEADRGGDVTFHGPGQLVGYPIIKIASSPDELNIEGYICRLESSLLQALKKLGLSRIQTVPGFRGIWLKDKVGDNKLVLKKLCAIGVGIKNGVTKHGFALNIDINPEPFMAHIIPCGLRDRGVMTLRQAFSQERLEMPSHLAIVRAVSESIAKTFSLELCFKGL